MLLPESVDVCLKNTKLGSILITFSKQIIAFSLSSIAGLLSGAMGSSKSGSGGGNYEEKPSKPFRRLPALNRQRLSGPTSGSSYTHGPENIYFNPVAQDFSHAMFQKDDDYWKANRGGSVPTFNPRKGLPEGGYVLTASDISNSFGNGSTDAGANYVWNNIADKNDPYAGIVKGKGDGMSDSIQTFINPNSKTLSNLVISDTKSKI